MKIGEMGALHVNYCVVCGWMGTNVKILRGLEHLRPTKSAPMWSAILSKFGWKLQISSKMLNFAISSIFRSKRIYSVPSNDCSLLSPFVMLCCWCNSIMWGVCMFCFVEESSVWQRDLTARTTVTPEHTVTSLQRLHLHHSMRLFSINSFNSEHNFRFGCILQVFPDFEKVLIVN